MKVIIIALLLSISITHQSEFIKYEEEGQIAILTINRPKALNALNSQVLDELDKTLDSIDKEKIRALIVTGAGEKSFVAGADIAEMSTLTKKQGEEFSKKGNDVEFVQIMLFLDNLKLDLELLQDLEELKDWLDLLEWEWLNK